MSQEKFNLMSDIDTLKELSRQSSIMQKMFTVKSYQKLAEEVEDPIVTDLLEHTDPRISEIQSKIVQKRL